MLITGDRKMRWLNRSFRGKDKTTDVLSFPALTKGELERLRRSGPAGDGPPVSLGDVVISAPRAMAQASELGHGFEDELVFLLAHGILHLAGYDHEAGQARERAMLKKQRELVARLRRR